MEKRWDISGFGSDSEEFESFVESLELQELSLAGSNYTLFEIGSGRARSTLDRFLVRDNGSKWSDGMVQQAVFKFSSEHLPIVLSSKVISHSLRLFCIFNAWSDNPNLRSVLEEEWDESGDSTSSFWGHMKAINGEVRRWQNDRFSQNDRRIDECEDKLKAIMTNASSTGQRELKVILKNKRNYWLS